MRTVFSAFSAITSLTVCVCSQAQVPPYSGYIFVDSAMPEPLYQALQHEVGTQENLRLADDCNLAESILVYRPSDSSSLQLLDKSGTEVLWQSKLSPKRVDRKARSLMSKLNQAVDSANKKSFQDAIFRALNEGSTNCAEFDLGCTQFDRAYYGQWEFYKHVDAMTDEETELIRQKEQASNLTLMFGGRGMLSFLDSSVYRPDPHGTEIQIRIGNHPHFTLPAKYGETDILFDLPPNLVSQFDDGGVILIRWNGHTFVPEDLQKVPPESDQHDVSKITTVFFDRNLKAAANSFLTGSCMYDYLDTSDN